MLNTILALLLAVHLLAVNVASAGPLVCIWLHRRSFRHGDAVAGLVGLQLAKACVSLLTLGIALGTIMLAIFWWVDALPYFDAMRQFPTSRYVNLLGELLFYYFCMMPYVWLWNRWSERRFWHSLLAVLAATNLLYHFPPLMAMLAVIPARADWQDVLITPDVYRTLLIDSEVLARVVHVWLASVATTGVAVMVLAMRSVARGAEPERAARLASFGAWVSLVPTLFQLLVGVWLLLALPSPAQSALLGEDLVGAGLMLLSLLAALCLMHQLAAVALGDVSRRTVVRSMVLLFALVLLMSGALRRADSLQNAAYPEADVSGSPASS